MNALDAAYRSLALSMAGAHKDVRLRIMEATILGNTSRERGLEQVNERRQKISFTTAAGGHERVGMKRLTGGDMSSLA